LGESGLWRDITLAGSVRAALRATEARFEMVFDCAPTALLIASLVDGRPAEFVRVNEAFSRLTGWPAVRLLGSGFADLAYPHERALDEQDLPVAQSPAQVTRVLRWLHVDGDETGHRPNALRVPAAV